MTSVRLPAASRPTLREKHAKDGASTELVVPTEGWATRPRSDGNCTGNARRFGMRLRIGKRPVCPRICPEVEELRRAVAEAKG